MNAATPQTLTNNLSWLRSHGIEAEATADGQISAVAVYTKDGKAHSFIEKLPNDRAVLRDWMGY